MTTMAEAGQQLRAALERVDGLKIYDDPADTIRLPAALVFAPELRLVVGAEATDAIFPVLLVVAADGNAIANLSDLVPRAAEAIHEYVENAVVTAASPGNYSAGGDLLPCYALHVEVAL